MKVNRSFFLIFFFFTPIVRAMGIIAPNVPVKKTDAKNNKNLLDGFLVDIALRTSEDIDGVIRSNAERAALKMWSLALTSEDDRVSQRALDTIFNRVGGKPNIKVEEEKQEMPEIVFQVSTKDTEKLKKLIEREPVRYEEESEDKVIVEIEGEPRMEF